MYIRFRRFRPVLDNGVPQVWNWMKNWIIMRPRNTVFFLSFVPKIAGFYAAIQTVENYVYLGLRVKCRRIVNSLTRSSLPLIDRERTDARHSPWRSKQWEYLPYHLFTPPEPRIIFLTHPPTLRRGPIIYAFLPSQATRCNSDFPSSPSVLCKSMRLSCLDI